jgi:hypothetical protein
VTEVNKKALIAAVNLSIILTSLFATVNRVNANPNTAIFPSTPNTTLPKITIQTPTQGGNYPKNNLTLDFNVTKPDASWFWGGYGVPPSDAIASISYTLDGNYTPVFSNRNNAVVDGLAGTSHYAFESGSLAEGKHEVRVEVVALHFYGGLTTTPSSIKNSNYISVTFDVDYNPPTIAKISIENQTYATSTLPLSFQVNEPEWVAYSLDCQNNVTIGGNLTINGLHDGTHSIIVYANNTAGTTCKSETVLFTVNTSTTETFTPAIILTSTIVAAIAVGLLIYLKKHKH